KPAKPCRDVDAYRARFCHCARKHSGIVIRFLECAARESVCAARGAARMRNLINDFRLGLRVLLRSPGFTLAAIAVLALGIGANSAIFSIVNAVLIRPLPYQDSSRIMQLWHTPPAKSFPG